MSVRSLTVIYKGPGVEDGTIDVADFGTSLIGLAELVHDAGQHLNPKGERVSVKIRAGFERGSFRLEILLEVIEAMLPVVQGMDPAQAFAIIIFGTSAAVAVGAKPVLGVLQLLKKLKGRPPLKVEPSGNDNVIVHIEGDNNTVIVSRPVLDLTLNQAIQWDTQRFASILEDGAVEEVEVVDEDAGVRAAIDWRERELLEVHPQDTSKDELTETSVIWVFPTRPAFKDTFTWWFEHRGEKLVAAMEDEDFKRRIADDGFHYQLGDSYKVEMRSVFPRPGKPGKARHAILKVLEQRHGDRQMKIGEKPPR